MINDESAQKKPPKTSFKPTDQIEKPFAQFSTIGAEFAEGIEFEDWRRVGKFIFSTDFGPSRAEPHDASKPVSDSGNKIVATAGLLSSQSKKIRTTDLPFSKNPPPRFGELLAMVNCLPPYDSIEFKLLHPLLVGIEMGEWPINFEKGVIGNAKFLRIVNALFEKSTREITNSKRSGIQGWGKLAVFSCGFWSARGFGLGITEDAEYLTGEYWRLILKKDYEAYSKLSYEQQNDFQMADENFEALTDLTCWTTRVDGREIDLDRRLITLDRAFRLGMSRNLTEFLVGDNPFACSTRMADPVLRTSPIIKNIRYHDLTVGAITSWPFGPHRFCWMRLTPT